MALLVVFLVVAGAVFFVATTHTPISAAQPAEQSVPSGEVP